MSIREKIDALIAEERSRLESERNSMQQSLTEYAIRAKNLQGRIDEIDMQLAEFDESVKDIPTESKIGSPLQRA